MFMNDWVHEMATQSDTVSYRQAHVNKHVTVSSLRAWTDRGVLIFFKEVIWLSM